MPEKPNQPVEIPKHLNVIGWGNNVEITIKVLLRTQPQHVNMEWKQALEQLISYWPDLKKQLEEDNGPSLKVIL